MDWSKNGDIDRQSRTWSAVKENAEKRVKEYHHTLSMQGISERDSDVLRGRINEILDLIEEPIMATETPQKADYTY